MIFYVYVVRYMTMKSSQIPLHNHLHCHRVVDELPFILIVIHLIKINSSEKSSESHGMAWSKVIPHTNDTGAPQTQQEDACVKYTPL